MDFFQERKLLVARRRTNEISGENLTNVFARTYTRRRITPIPIEFPDFSQFSGKIGGGRQKRGEREKKRKRNRQRRSSSRNRLDSRLSRGEPAIPSRSRKPLDRSYFLDKSCSEADNGREKGRKSRESRVSSSPIFHLSVLSVLPAGESLIADKSEPPVISPLCVWSRNVFREVERRGGRTKISLERKRKKKMKRKKEEELGRNGTVVNRVSEITIIRRKPKQLYVQL